MANFLSILIHYIAVNLPGILKLNLIAEINSAKFNKKQLNFFLPQKYLAISQLLWVGKKSRVIVKQSKSCLDWWILSTMKMAVLIAMTMIIVDTTSQKTFDCLKSTIETLEKGVTYTQS